MPQEPTAAYPQDTAVSADPVYEPVEQEQWLDQTEELPQRPRRRLLGVGANRLALALIGLLLIACGFIGGVLIEKGESSSGSSGSAAAGLASRFAALRGGTGAGAFLSRGLAGGSGGSVTGFHRPTAGTVAYLSGSTLYVTNSEGNTVKVTTSSATTVNKTVKSTVRSVHPGETVTITGSTGSNGAISAESISVGSSGAGLASLFGGGSGQSGSRSSAGGAGESSGGEPALFGK